MFILFSFPFEEFSDPLSAVVYVALAQSKICVCLIGGFPPTQEFVIHLEASPLPV